MRCSELVCLVLLILWIWGSGKDMRVTPIDQGRHGVGFGTRFLSSSLFASASSGPCFIGTSVSGWKCVNCGSEASGSTRENISLIVILFISVSFEPHLRVVFKNLA